MLIKRLKLISHLFALAAFCGLCIYNSSVVYAFSANDLQSINNNTAFYDPKDGGGQTCTAGGASTGSNLDYAGRPILNAAQLQAISQNTAVYQEAAQQVDIPWQMLAVVHLREHGLQVSNPSNGQGIYQFFDKHGGPYPAGPVTQAEFLRQTILAAQFLKAKATSSNYTPDQNLTASSDANTIKDTFYSYNGRAYSQQAAQNGFDANTQAYEGSPYVMNKADTKRDSDTLGPGETTWGQVKVDNGPIEYPANSDYGAFVEYAALTGIPLSGGCSSAANCGGNATNAAAGLSQTRQGAVCLAQQELQKWQTGQLVPVDGFLTYSQNHYEEWCADFVSWIYDQVGYPLQPDPNWRVSYVPNIQNIGTSNQNFHWHPNDGTYTPQPGDLGLFGGKHVVIVVGVSGNAITTIGGDEGGPNYGTQEPPSTSSIKTDNYTDYKASGITGFVTPD